VVVAMSALAMNPSSPAQNPAQKGSAT
jgi:hypothetical protein